MRIDSYYGPVTDAFAAEVASLAGRDPASIPAIDIARALRSNLVACLWYENGVKKLEAIAAMQCIENLTGEKWGRISEIYASPSVSPEQVRALVEFLSNVGARWGVRHITVDCFTHDYGVDQAGLQLLCEMTLMQTRQAETLRTTVPAT
ncbi:MAG: hypothetical protein KBE09_02025 [Candidatus Pacebacteria bacterium]|nr:hypothetical protein [Candidatus Paceibacterota bacterium]